MSGSSASEIGNASSSSSSASCDDCTHCPQNIRILLAGSSPEFIDYLEFHITRYREVHPHIHVTLDSTAELERELLESRDWDGSIFPAQSIGALTGENVLWDLTNFIHTSFDIEWTDVLPFFRGSSATFHAVQRPDEDQHRRNSNENDKEVPIPYAIPLDGDLISMYYRKDLFDQFNMTIPRTWEEYNQAAAFFQGRRLGPGGSILTGSCVSRTRRCANENWASLILSTMTQAEGTSSGFFLDPVTMEPLFGPAMEETLRLLREQFTFGRPDELSGDCLEANAAFNDGTCALTYNWGNQITGLDNIDFEVGVAPTPGSSQILDRGTGRMVNCTAHNCPYATYYEDIGLVNHANYAGFGGWMAGVSNQAPASRQYAVADFFAYISNSRQSLNDILLGNEAVFAQSYRYTHLKSSDWISAGLNPTLASDYTDAVRRVNSENSVLELRVPAGSRMRTIVDDEVFSYLRDGSTGLIPEQEVALRKRTVEQMERKIKDLVRSEERVSTVRLSNAYRSSIGHIYVSPSEINNYINESFRDAAWGLSGLMCVTIILLMIWTFRHRNNRVMKAFQPFLLLQSCAGLLLMSASIIPLGFDDSLYDKNVLDGTCMLAPWLYVVGFTLFFASVYAKIKECIKIYSDPGHHHILLVRPNACLLLTTRLLILNCFVLALWTGTDRLVWERQEVDGGMILVDGTVETFGTCRGGAPSLAFSVVLYLLNMVELLIATVQAFKCRFLVLEYNEMQWLPLSVFPFFEVWLIGGPILLLVHESPTVTFVLLSAMVVASVGVGGMAVFAPKDWYHRKYYHSYPEQKGFPERTTSAGIMVLQHPTVENQRQIESLSYKVEETEALNTELEIEIRMMKEKFKELTFQEKVHLRESLRQEAHDDESPTFHSRTIDPGFASTDQEGMEALEKFQQVWKMPDEDDYQEEHQDTISRSIARIGSFHSQASLGADDSVEMPKSYRGIGVESAPRNPHENRRPISKFHPAAPPSPNVMTDSSSDAGSFAAPPSPNAMSDSSSDDNKAAMAPPSPRDMSDSSSYDARAAVAPSSTNEMSDSSSAYNGAPMAPPSPRDMSDSSSDDNRAAMAPPSTKDMSDSSSDDRFPLESMSDDEISDVSSEAPDEILLNKMQTTGEDEEGEEEEPLRPNGINNRLIVAGRERKDPPALAPTARKQSTLRKQTDSGANGKSKNLSRKVSRKPFTIGEDEKLTDEEIIARIVAMRLAAADASESENNGNDSMKSFPEDPLVRLMKMIEEDEAAKAKGNDGEDSKDKKSLEEELVSRIIALRLAAIEFEETKAAEAGQDGQEEEEESDNEETDNIMDPLERIMKMNAEDRLISAMNLKRFEQQVEEEEETDDDFDEDALIRKRELQDLSSMILEDDLNELERRAAVMANSIKNKLTASQLADLTQDTEASVDDSDVGRGYLALAHGGHRDTINTSHSMAGLDISKISSDDGDRRFISMTDSILDTSHGFGVTPESDSPASSGYHSGGRATAGQSSGDARQRAGKGLSFAAAAMLGQGEEHATQFAGEPSQGEGSRFGFGFKGVMGKETIGDSAFRSPLTTRKKKAGLLNGSSRSDDSPVQNKSYSISDWAAVGGIANVLADWSDSQSNTSYTESGGYADSVQDSVTSLEATTRASALETPMANEIDKLVGTMDWDGVKMAAKRYESSFTRDMSAEESRLAALREKRMKKRELEAEAEAWRESLAKSFSHDD